MKPRDWFLVGVRLIGVWWIVYGVMEAFTFLTAATRLYVYQGVAPLTYLIRAAVNLSFGFYLLKGAPFLLNIGYLRESDSPAPSDETPPE